MLESPAGDPLRRPMDGTPADPDGSGHALFRFLAGGKQSVVADPTSESDIDLALGVIAGADVVLWSPGSPLAEHPGLTPHALRKRFPAAIVTSISPFGLDGPWADRPATEFTLQASAGAIGWRGKQGRAPISSGGRIGEWVSGVYATIGAMASVRRREVTGDGELLDVAMYDAVGLTLTNMHPISYFSQAGRPRDPRPMSLLPGVHPTADDWVGFMTVTGQQWQDFCILVERFDWLEDESLILASVREERRAEVTAGIEEWTRGRTTAEVLEAAAELRVPAAPIGTGATVAAIDHFVDQGMFVPSADGTFVQPATPVRLAGVESPEPRPAPGLGEHTETWRSAPPRRQALPGRGVDPAPAPYAGLRIIDLTAFWAGPSATQFFGVLGAEVIKVESPDRPDGMRGLSLRAPGTPDWQEHAPLFHATNTGKLGLGLRLDRPEGRELLRDLVARSDVLVENFSPRVLEGWGMTFEDLREINPRLIVVRMPAFGTSGPWRDRTGFAQSMEQVSGMAWVTGYPDGAPVVPSGCCDPIAGAHGAFALQLALEVRDRTGLGLAVEVPMVLSALNVAAEQLVEHSAYGRLLNRLGNRGRTAAPQNLYRSRLDDQDPLGGYVALSVETDEQWRALCAVVPDLVQVCDAGASLARRHEAADAIDEVLEAWCAGRPGPEAVDGLINAGIPAAQVRMPHEPDDTQWVARGFLEHVEHPLVAPTTIVGLPIRFGNGPHRFHGTPAPMVGADTVHVLREVLGRSAEDVDRLLASGVVGQRVPSPESTNATTQRGEER